MPAPEQSPSPEQTPELHASFGLMDFRAGHWPGTKTPPWWLNEMWEGQHPEWRAAIAHTD